MYYAHITHKNGQIIARSAFTKKGAYKNALKAIDGVVCTHDDVEVIRIYKKTKSGSQCVAYI